MVLPRILAAALLAAACSDSIGPRGGPPPVQRMPVGLQSDAGDIVLDQQNSAMGQSGRRFVKGFNPTNPHNGDAIVVTFFWVGSTNIITSVTDHLTNTNWPPVGNTYRLVEYVTSGGISMATYVATNAQNIPVANQNQDNVLAVEALLSDSVVDGGIWLSAWSNVAGVFDSAVGAHVSGSGTGSAPTAAHPGFVTTTNPRSLVYGVTMSRPRVGVDPPPGFTTVDPFGSIGDTYGLKADARYLLQATAGSVDPHWTWYYDQTNSGTWLATGLVLNPGTVPPPQPPGNLTVNASTSGTNVDPDGYTVTVDGTRSQPVGTNGSVTFTSLAAGNHSVAIGGVASNCSVTTANPQTVSVPSGGTATASAPVNCGASDVAGITLDTVAGASGESAHRRSYICRVSSNCPALPPGVTSSASTWGRPTAPSPTST